MPLDFNSNINFVSYEYKNGLTNRDATFRRHPESFRMQTLLKSAVARPSLFFSKDLIPCHLAVV